MSSISLPYRQVHLDFHTSPDIEEIGANFDPDEFVGTLEKARVNSVSCFARCHHGLLYYDSKKFPERIHPYLKNKNLLKEQIEACHQKDIRVPIYITVQWDHFTAEEHPEWLVLDENGSPINTKIYEAGFYRSLCVNTPYRDFLKEQTQEVLEMFHVDGFFFDIVKPVECNCKHCRDGMKRKGMNPTNKEHRQEFAQEMIDEFKMDMTHFVRQYNQYCSIFYNGGHIGPAQRSVKKAYTHFEVESLASGYWGYLHFPLTMQYARNLGLDCLGLTGKFHTMWGDFHSFKNQAALEFECFRMLALNAKCMIGDQLDPNGRISKPVYELIGSVYAEVEKKEAWCKEAKAVTEVGVFTPEEFYGAKNNDMPTALMGIVRMLQESGIQFDILDTKSDLSRYKVLVLPDHIPVDEMFSSKLEQYIASGGAIIASYESGLDPKKKDFNLGALGVTYQGDAPFSPDFIVPTGDMGKGLPETEHVMYKKGLQVGVNAESEILSQTKIPYFNRTWEHFCSHRHTPSSGQNGYPAIVKNGNILYFIHPIFTQYNQNAPRWCKQLFLNGLDMFLPERLIRHNGPTTMQVTLNEQRNENRWVVHLLHYIPERRSKDIDIIEDVIPLYDIELSILTSRDIEGIHIVPDGQSLPFEKKDGRIEFLVPKIEGHQMIEVRF